jgi:hypothetical protein
MILNVIFQDVLRLTSVLPNLVRNYLVPYELWNHLDFLWGKDAYKILYPEVLRNMEDFREDFNEEEDSTESQ